MFISCNMYMSMQHLQFHAAYPCLCNMSLVHASMCMFMTIMYELMFYMYDYEFMFSTYVYVNV
jgi:hypothetical protein